MRSSNGWGSISVPGGRLTSDRHYGAVCVLHRPLPAADGRRAAPIISEYRVAEHRAQRHHQLEQLDVQPRADREQRHALRPGPARGRPTRCPASSPRRATSTRCTTLPLSKMIQPRLGATWAYNGQRHRLRQLRPLQPGRQLAASRRVLGPQPGGDFIDAHFDANGKLVRRRRRSARRPASCSSRTSTRARSTSTWSARRGRSTAAWSARAYGRYRDGATSGKTPTTTRASRFDAAGRAFRAGAVHPGPRRQAGADRHGGSTYVIAELDGAFTKYYEATLESGVARREDLRPRLLHLEPLLRQLRPGQHHRLENDMNIFIGSSNIADGAGRQLWDNKDGGCAATGRTCSSSMATTQLPWRATVGAFFVVPVGPAVGERGATSRTRP